MEFNDIGLAMLRKYFVLGHQINPYHNHNGRIIKAGVFMTDKNNIYLDANIVKSDDVISAKVELVDNNYQLYLIKGVKNAIQGAYFIQDNTNKFIKSKQ